MIRIFICISICISAFLQPTTAQDNPTTSANTRTIHRYYFYVTGVETKADFVKFSHAIARNSSIINVGTFHDPVYCYFIESFDVITEDILRQGMDASKYKLIYFGEGEIAKEKAIVEGFKTKKK